MRNLSGLVVCGAAGQSELTVSMFLGRTLTYVRLFCELPLRCLIEDDPAADFDTGEDKIPGHSRANVLSTSLGDICGVVWRIQVYDCVEQR